MVAQYSIHVSSDGRTLNPSWRVRDIADLAEHI